MKYLTCLIITICIIITHAQATTFYVDGANGNDIWDGLSPAFITGNNGPFQTFAAAVDRATNCDKIVVLDGTYSGYLYISEQIFTKIDQKHIHFCSASGPDQCILLCQDLLRFNNFSNPLSPTTILEGFTVKSAFNYSPLIFINNGNPTFKNCIFSDSLSDGNRPFVDINGTSKPLFQQCRFEQNRNFNHIILCYDDSILTLDQCQFVGNYTSGAEQFELVRCENSSQTSMTQCLFRENFAYSGFVCINVTNEAQLLSENCTIENNFTYGWAPYLIYGIHADQYASLDIYNSTIKNLYSWDLATPCRVFGVATEFNKSTMSLEPHLTIENSNIFANISQDFGGGILCQNLGSQNVPVVISNSVISDNQARQGGGVICAGNVAVEINDSTIQNNITEKATGDGGGVYRKSGDPFLILQNCLITGNSRGGITFWTESPRVTIQNCTIADNDDHGVVVNHAQINNTIIYQNTGGAGYQLEGFGDTFCNYCDIQFGWEGLGTGNFDSDPLFAPSGLDYHLQSNAGRYDPATSQWVQDTQFSPGIDAGNPTLPIAEEPYGSGGIINIGAYGGTPHASLTDICSEPIYGDINKDCTVNLFDFAILAAHWMTSTKFPGL